MDGYRVEHTPRDEVRDFILEHHYSGTCGMACMTWGLYDDDDELVGGAAFQTPISEAVRSFPFGEDHKDRVTELQRFVTLDRCPKNAESWFLARALDSLKDYKSHYWGVLSYADTTEGHIGTIYQATNALYLGTAKERVFYRDHEGNLRTPRIGGENITLEDARERGWETEHRGIKHRYLFLLPDGHRHKKELRSKLEPEVQEYPSKEELEEVQQAVAEA